MSSIVNRKSLIVSHRRHFVFRTLRASSSETSTQFPLPLT
ncbi:hypothetical protein LINPERPRIM_LOCUS41398 [Linum perenne]